MWHGLWKWKYLNEAMSLITDNYMWWRHELISLNSGRLLTAGQFTYWITYLHNVNRLHTQIIDVSYAVSIFKCHLQCTLANVYHEQTSMSWWMFVKFRFKIMKCLKAEIRDLRLQVPFTTDYPDCVCVSTLWSRSPSKCYLRIQSVPEREHHTSPLQKSTG
jgi:hypothetical protein